MNSKGKWDVTINSGKTTSGMTMPAGVFNSITRQHHGGFRQKGTRKGKKNAPISVGI